MRDKLIEKIIEKLEEYGTEDLIEKLNIDFHDLVRKEIDGMLEKMEIDLLLEFLLEL